MSLEALRYRAEKFKNEANRIEIEQLALLRTKEQCERMIQQFDSENRVLGEELDICSNAITILTSISDDVVKCSYRFIEENLNIALERIFRNSVRKIRLKESVRGGTSPQLSIELTVENGVVRSLKDDSGHGLMQLVSFMCVLCVIGITGARRLIVIDEVLSGLSAEARQTASDIMEAFAAVGYQFVVSEHGFIPANAYVHELELKNGVTNVKKTYLSNGVFLTRGKDDTANDDEGAQEYQLVGA